MSYWKFTPGEQASKSIDNQSASGPGKAFSFKDYEKAQWLIVFSNGAATGDVIIESAHDPNYLGTWHALTAAPVTASSNTAKGGNADFPPGGYVRARIGTLIGGGTVTVYLNGVQAE